APEQARHSHLADIRSDIYSLGCTLYHMIAGQVPFPSPSLSEKLFAHHALEPRPLQQLVPDVPAGLVEVVQRMMRKRPEERYTARVQVARALEPFMGDHARPRQGESEAEPSLIDEAAQPARFLVPEPAGAEAPRLTPAALGSAAPSPDAATKPHLAGGRRAE